MTSTSAILVWIRYKQGVWMYRENIWQTVIYFSTTKEFMTISGAFQQQLAKRNGKNLSHAIAILLGELILC